MSYQSIILLTFLFCLMSSMAEEDYYNILGVKKYSFRPFFPHSP